MQKLPWFFWVLWIVLLLASIGGIAYMTNLTDVPFRGLQELPLIYWVLNLSLPVLIVVPFLRRGVRASRYTLSSIVLLFGGIILLVGAIQAYMSKPEWAGSALLPFSAGCALLLGTLLAHGSIRILK